jgi:hypothetical protein
MTNRRLGYTGFMRCVGKRKAIDKREREQMQRVRLLPAIPRLIKKAEEDTKDK